MRQKRRGRFASSVNSAGSEQIKISFMFRKRAVDFGVQDDMKPKFRCKKSRTSAGKASYPIHGISDGVTESFFIEF
jgi:hypothetical protein